MCMLRRGEASVVTPQRLFRTLLPAAWCRHQRGLSRWYPSVNAVDRGRKEVLPRSRPSLCSPGSKNHNCSCSPWPSPPSNPPPRL